MSSETIAVRPMIAEDIPACVRIVVEWISETPWMKRKDGAAEIEPHFHRALKTGRTLLVASAGEEIGGYLSMDGEHFVHGIYVAKSRRGHGIGKSLLDAAKRIHPDFLSLTVYAENRSARDFYEREGFRLDNNGETFDADVKLTALRMCWRGMSK